MPQGGILTIETAVGVIDAPFIQCHGYGRPGRYAVVTVSDTGSGMNDETQKRIFEPFFTTKEPGKGTGLGLAVASGIVAQHNGFIDLRSEPGKGSRFLVYLPLLEGGGLHREEPCAAEPPRGQGETILVAEDESILRGLVASILTGSGYNVLLAADGEAVVEQFRENRERIGMILMDMIMPKQSGKAAEEEIRKLHPEAKVLFISGYTADFISRRGLDEQGLEVIMKPFQPRELLCRVRELLDRGGGMDTASPADHGPEPACRLPY
jgi:polar amino acid transport system substrate-binding protein